MTPTVGEGDRSGAAFRGVSTQMTTTPIDEYRRTSYEISQAIAPGWSRRRAQFEAGMTPVRDWMVRELASRDGDTVLELAAGAGDTGFAAAPDAGRLICTDFSPAMLDVARDRAGELGITNVEFRVTDAERIDLDTASVDGVLCRLGYMLVADPAAALAETRRVLRPGGRVVLAVWAAAERNPFFAVIARTLVERGHVTRPPDGVPNPFSMANPDRTRSLLQAAGFAEVTVEEIPLAFRFRDVDDYLGFMADTAGPLAVALRKLSEPAREDLAAVLENALASFATDDGYSIPGAALVASARSDERVERAAALAG
jgi:ubiquinone/menaquinone biosynthesis C-methylase UbiE